MNSLREERLSLQDSFNYCRAVMADRAKSFYHAFSLLPAERFKGVYTIYAFCRYVDDIVDNQSNVTVTSDVESQLLSLEQALKDFLDHHHNHSVSIREVQHLPWWPAFEVIGRKYQMTSEPFIEQINGQRMDLSGKRIATLDHLLQYCRGVAGSVGRMLLPLIISEKADLNDSYLQESCYHLGIGMQITNILRDIGEDIRDRQRIYLPQTLLEKYNVSPSYLATMAQKNDEQAFEVSQDFINLWESLYHLSNQYYQSIEDQIFKFHPKARLPLLASAYIYQAIGEEVRQNKYNCFTKRNYTSHIQRIQLTAKAKKVLHTHKDI